MYKIFLTLHPDGRACEGMILLGLFFNYKKQMKSNIYILKQ